ncbi:MAG: hypothetical protein NXI17_05855 [Alphaproteobacteria bacterium]|nr:hypothetical protein [Alphaproteobacteria bacterium]
MTDRRKKIEPTASRREALEQGARRTNREARASMVDTDRVWYAGFVLSGKEFIAQKLLKRVGAVPYLPLCQKWRRVNRYRREKVRIAYPAIAGSLFLGFERGQENWYEVFQRAPNLYGVLGANGYPVALDGNRLNRFITENKFRFGAADEERFMRTHHEFKIGDRVQIVSGPFDGNIVDVKTIKGSHARILLELFGGTQEVEIGLDNLEKAA